MVISKTLMSQNNVRHVCRSSTRRGSSKNLSTMGVSQALVQLRTPVTSPDFVSADENDPRRIKRPQSPAMVAKFEMNGNGVTDKWVRSQSAAIVKRQSRTGAKQELTKVYDRWQVAHKRRGIVSVSYPQDAWRTPIRALQQPCQMAAPVALSRTQVLLLERWSPRFERAKKRRLLKEFERAMRARAELSRPERRKAAEEEAERCRHILSMIVHLGIRTYLMQEKLEADRKLMWGDEWEWNNAKKKDEEAVQQENQDSMMSTWIERRGSISSIEDQRRLEDEKTKEKDKRRTERIQEYIAAATIIRRWFVAIKYKRLVKGSRWVPFLLGRFVRRVERDLRVKWRNKATDILAHFLTDTRRTGASAIRRLQRSVRRVQTVVRIWGKCRGARLTLLEKAFIRQERWYREELFESNRVAQLLALERMQKNPMFGARTVRLYAANARLKKLLSFSGNNKLSLPLKATSMNASGVHINHNTDLVSIADSVDANSLVQNDVTKREYKSWNKHERRKFLEDLLTKQRRAYQAQSEDDYYESLRNMHKVNISDVRKLLHQKTNTRVELDAHIMLSKHESLERHPLFCVLTRNDGALSKLKSAICHCK